MTIHRSTPRRIAVLAASLFCVSIAHVTTFAAGPIPGSAAIDPAAAARDVFQDPGFWWKRIEPRPVSSSWFDSILKATADFFGKILGEIARLLGRILEKLLGVTLGVATGGALVVCLVVVMLLVLSLWKLYPLIVGWLYSEARPPSPRAGDDWQTLAEASELLEQSVQAFRDGLYAEAIRLALLALIARFEKQGLLRYDPTRTNREYQRELRDRGDLAACFGQVARIYERIWYGRASADRAEAKQAIMLCGSVINNKELAPE